MTGTAVSRGTLFRFAGWFAMANALVVGAVSLRYLGGGLPETTALSLVYLVAVYIGHHVLVTTLPLLAVLTPVIVVYPRRGLVTNLAIVLFAMMIALMILDSLLWSQSRFHLSALSIRILGWQSWVFAGVIFTIGLFFQSMLAKGAWGWVEAKRNRKGGLLGLFCALMVVSSQMIHAWADAAYYVPVTGLGQVLPVYKGVTAKSFMAKYGLVDMKSARERELARRVSQDLDASSARLLNYPRNPLQCEAGNGVGGTRPENLLFIIVDSMRETVLTPENAPRISAFAAEKAADFRNHFSGGNSSRMGMFSLFYGLPPGYWSSFSSLQTPTVLIDELQRQDFQLGLFSSATLVRPVVLDRTAFARVPKLRLQSEPASDPPWKRDLSVNREWIQWLDDRDSTKPFFGFLFYDATMSGKPPDDYESGLEPLTELPIAPENARNFERYRTSVHFNDSLVGEVLDDLERRGLLDRTVVVISSDHGEEFGESSARLTRHGSGYTSYQLQVPMVVSWPGREPGVVYQHRTSHYDLVPTLMADFLACDNPAEDYSVGKNLFEQRSWEWMLAGSYFNYAVLEPDQVTVTFPNGLYEVRDWNYRLIDKPRLRGEVLEAVSEQNARFFH